MVEDGVLREGADESYSSRVWIGRALGCVQEGRVAAGIELG